MKTPTRNSGKSQTEEITEAASDLADEEISGEDPSAVAEDMKRFRTPGFTRMRIDWNSDDREIIKRARDMTHARIIEAFKDAYEVMNEIFEVVREPETDNEGAVIKDRFGYVQWKRTPRGTFIEDWTKLTRKEKESFLFAITTRVFDWEQRSADIWAEAMFAKGAWEERFAIDYERPLDGTIEDRTAAARVGAREERYLAIFMAYLSRSAEGVVRSMNLIGQRLRDSMMS